MTGWISVLTTITVILLSAAAQWGYNKRRWDEMEAKLKRHEEYHGEHRQHAQQPGHPVTLQRLNEHQAQFERIDQYLTEMRQDIKELLRIHHRDDERK